MDHQRYVTLYELVSVNLLQHSEVPARGECFSCHRVLQRWEVSRETTCCALLQCGDCHLKSEDAARIAGIPCPLLSEVCGCDGSSYQSGPPEIYELC